MEAVQEMKVQVHTYDAEMGRTGGGVMNMAAQVRRQPLRGLRLHGASARRVCSRAAADPAACSNERSAPEYWRNGGGGGGGPIVKNKTFFWVAGEKYVNNQPQPNAFLVPTTADAHGDFSGADCATARRSTSRIRCRRRLQLHHRRARLLPRQRHPGQPPQPGAADRRATCPSPTARSTTARRTSA